MALQDAAVVAANDDAQTLSLQLLGPLGIRAADGEPVTGLGAGKSLAILAYICVRGNTRRDELISVLWGDVPEANARNAFRQSLHRLKAALGEHVLSLGRDQVGIDDKRRLTVDRDTFMEACDLGNWEAAVAAYGGEFLEGFETGEPAFDRWADSERVRLRSRFQECLLAAARQATIGGMILKAVQFAERLVAAAPYDESAALLQANTLVAAGRPGQALAAVRQFAARLNEDLDLQVSPAVRSLTDRLEKVDTIRAQTAGSARTGERVEPTTFVGRQTEISRLLGALGRLKAGRGGTMLVEGESGSGKSRLLDEFTERTKQIGGVLMLRGREIGNGGVVAYAAVAEALRPIVRAAGVSGASRHLLAEAARLLPELRDSFDLPPVSALEDETGRLRLFEGVAAVIDAAAYEKPVCVILDDIQHSSASTLDLITYLSQRLRESPVLLIAAYRPDRSASQSIARIRQLTGNNGLADDCRVALGPLEDAEVKLLVEDTVRRAPTGPPFDVDRIVARSRGIPFDAIELARRASERGLGDELPAAMRDVLWSRLQTASAAQRRVFFACSLFQRRAALRLLAAAAHLPEGATLDAAQELVRVGLLCEMDDGFVIAHDSAASFLVESSGLSGRSLLAGWAADALAAEDAAADAELAALYAVAGRGADAFVRARAGAFAASAMGAGTEVVRLLEIALTFAPDQGARREIGSLLGAFGRGYLSLPLAATREPAVGGTAEGPPIEEPPVAPNGPAFTGEPDVVVEPLDETVDAAAAAVAAPRMASARQWIMSVAISLVVILAGYFARREVIAQLGRSGASDTLFLVERDTKGQNQVRAIASAEKSDGTTLASIPRAALGPPWIDSLRAPFAGALVSPDRMRVAMERVTPAGDELLVVSADRRDSIIVQAGARNGVPLGWSPDSRGLLVQRARTLDDGSLDLDLYVSWIGVQRDVPIDTFSTRAVTEAKWSPTGVWIAWAARTGASRRRRIFISRPDGSDMRSVAASAADDYNIDWSPDGSLIAFTSTRSGGRRLYVYDLDDNRLWPVSDRDGEDDARFSPDGRMIAFESTRDGDRAIYLRPALGGSPRRVTPAGRQLSIAAWRGHAAAYVDRLRIVGESSVDLGDSVRLGWLAVTPSGASVSNPEVRLKVLDGLVVQADTGQSAAIYVVGLRAGGGRVVASIPGWRSDTLTVLVSSAQSFHVDDDFARVALGDHWMALGRPAPYIGRMPGSSQRALFPNGDMEWDSGILLRSTLQLRAGVRADARVTAPFDGRPSATRLTIAFVLAIPQTAIDTVAPRFSTVVGAQWDGASGNLTYSVGQESSSEPASALSAASSHMISIVVHRDVVTFSVDGQTRWQSSLKYLGDGSGTPVQFWIGGRATGSSVAVSRVVVDLAGKATAQR